MFLGVVPAFVSHLLDNESDDTKALRRFFPALGERFELRADKTHLHTALNDAQALIFPWKRQGYSEMPGLRN